MIKYVRCVDGHAPQIISEEEMRVMHVVNLMRWIRRPGGWT